jgi:hypothetical protein
MSSVSKKPTTSLIARRLATNGWVYDDKTEHAFALTCGIFGFNLVEFDNWLEGEGWESAAARKNQQWFLNYRAQALIAFKDKDRRLLRTTLDLLSTAQSSIRTDDALLPKARHGSKFVGKKPGAAGPVRKAITRVLKVNPAAKTEEVWLKLKSKPPQKMDFHGTGRSRHIWTEGRGMTSWHRFQSMVSEERAKLRD